MSRSPFRPSVQDRMDVIDRLDERVHAIPSRSWILFAIQGVLLAALVSWAVVGRLPINARGEAVYLGAPGVDALVALPSDDAHHVPVGARAVLEAGDGTHERLTGTVVALSESAAWGQPLSRVAGAGCDCGRQAAQLGVALTQAAARKHVRGDHFSAQVTLREETPLARVLSGWWH